MKALERQVEKLNFDLDKTSKARRRRDDPHRFRDCRKSRWLLLKLLQLIHGQRLQSLQASDCESAREQRQQLSILAKQLMKLRVLLTERVFQKFGLGLTETMGRSQE